MNTRTNERTPEQFAYPYINSNGTSREALLQDRKEARRAVRAAMVAFGECSPHGRDYQTAPPGAYEAARARYNERFAALDKLCNELGEEAEFIYFEQR